MVRDTLVDIVIIGRNEGELLCRAIQTSQAAARLFAALGNPEPRIIYVDGRSTDGSLELARSLGAECYVVEDHPNAAAGRHLGFTHCVGEYVFFVDGDMEVSPGWLPAAVAFLHEHAMVAGVGGYVDYEISEDGKTLWIPNYHGVRKHGQEVTTDVGGAMVYRTKVLREVGDFDPTIIRGEEFELYLRIAAEGYKLVYLAIPMVIHRDRKGNMGKNYLIQSIFNRSIFIPGVVARKAPRNLKVLRLLLKRYWLFLWHTISVVAICLAAACALTTHQYAWAVVSAAVLVQLIYAHWVYKHHNITRALVSVLIMNCYIVAYIMGYVSKWPPVGGYYRS